MRLLSSCSDTVLRRHLRRGGVVAYPTESCYGLGALPQHRGALRRILRLKKRPQHKGMIVIAADTAQLRPLLQPLAADEYRRLAALWPAPTTVLLPAARHILPELRGRRRDKLAVRVPDHAAARRLCRVVRSPLVSTSCNRAGGRPCRTEREVRRQFGRRLMIIGGRIGRRRQPSTIIDWASGRRVR